MNFKNLLPIASNELVFELLEQNSLLPNNFWENNNPERKEVDPNSPEQKEVIKQTSEKLTTLESNINSENNKKDIRLLRKAYRDYYKDWEFDRSKLENFLWENIKKYLSDDLQVNWKQATDQDRLMLFMWDSNFSGSVESMVDNENYKRQTKFGRKVFGEYKKWALGRETERRDSGIVWWDQIVDMMRSIFADTPDKDKSNIYFNLWTEFSKYANITENISVSDSKSFIKPFADKPELYIKFREFLNTFALQLADMISVWAQDTLKQLSEDYERINLSIKEIETETKNILGKNPNIKNNVQKWLENKSDDIVKKQLELNKKLESLPDNQKWYLLYLEDRNSDFDHSTITPTEKQAVDQLFSQKNSLIEERAMVNKVKSDSKLLNQFVTQELSMWLHYLSIIDDGKLIPLSSEDGKNQGKARLQAISAWYGVNYKLWEDGRSFRTWGGAARVPWDNIFTPSMYAGLWKTFTVGRWQFISLWLITSWWINWWSWWVWAWLGVWWSHQRNNRTLDKDLDEYVSKSLNRWVWAYMDLSKAFSYGATIGAKFDKESGINQKIPILAEWFANIFDGLLKDFGPNNSSEDNKKLIKEKIIWSFDKTKDNKKLDLFVDQVYWVASVVWNSLNWTDKDYSRKQISIKLSHMFANGVWETEHKKLSKISIDGFNINVAAITLWFANPLMFLLSVTPSIKVRWKNFYIEDQQTKNRAEEDKNKFIWAKEIQNKQSLLDKINGVLGPKDKVEFSDNNKTISIPAELLDRGDLTISVNSQYKTLLESHTKFEGGKWIVPSWMGMTFYNQFESRWATKHEIMFFGNKKNAGQKFEVVNKETIQKFAWDPSVDIPQEYMSYTKESIKKAFDDLDSKVLVDLSTYFDINYDEKTKKVTFVNKKLLTSEGEPTISQPFDPKWTIIFEKNKDTITITQSDKEWPLSFEFIDKDLNDTKLNFEEPELWPEYTNFLKEFETNWYFDYGKIGDLKYVKAQKWDHQLDGIKVAWVVQSWKYRNGRPKYNRDNAKLVWQDSFKEFSLALNTGNYEMAAQKANELLQSNGKPAIFDANNINELHDFNIKLTWERAAKTISKNSIMYTRDPKKIVEKRTDRYENKRINATWIPTSAVNWFRNSISLEKGKDLTVNNFDGIGVVLWYEETQDFIDKWVNTNSKYIINPRYVWDKSEISDPIIKKDSIKKLIESKYLQENILSTVYKKLKIALPQQTPELWDKIIDSIKEDKDIEANWSKYTLDPKLYFAFYPDCLNESLLIDFEIKNKTNAQVWKESDVDDDYSNNSTVTNVVANARAYVRPTVSGSVMQAPDSKTNPDVVDSETDPGITDVKYEIIDNVKTTTITYNDGKVLIVWDAQDGSPMSWNYWYYESDGSFISISNWLGSSVLYWKDLNTLPTNVQWNIIDPTKANVTNTQTTTNVETWRTRWNLIQATTLWVTNHTKPQNLVLVDIINRAKQSSENYKKPKKIKENNKEKK